jgi:hypothetical protein
MIRNNLSYRRRSTGIIVNQELVEKSIDEFYNKLTGIVELYSLSIFANFDETSIKIDSPCSQTIEEKGTKHIPVKTTNSELIKFTVVLGGISNGTKLSPLILFPGSGAILKKKLKSNIVKVFFTESGNMTKDSVTY